MTTETLTYREGGPEKEVESLRDSSLELADPRLVNVNLGSDTRLQIYDVSEDPEWNSDYVVIDPESYDLNAGVGYKGIWAGEPLTLGREASHGRFNFPDTVSRSHLLLEVGEEHTLKITDLDSTNGTRVEWAGGRRVETDSKSAAVDHPDLKEFLGYASSATESNSLNWPKIYTDFYSADSQSEEALQGRINQAVLRFWERQEALGASLAQKYPDKVAPYGDDSHWMGFHINGDTRYSGGDAHLGRFYLNIHPDHISDVFEDVVVNLAESGLPSQTKAIGSKDRSAERTAKALQRSDKLVIYFDSDNQDKALEVLEAVYSRHQNSFLESRPKFTASLRSTDGQEMKGIGFAQEPTVSGSFGQIRSTILGEVALDAKLAGKSLDDPQFGLAASFTKHCKELGVDPSNPAFNLGGEILFHEIAARVSEA